MTRRWRVCAGVPGYRRAGGAGARGGRLEHGLRGGDGTLAPPRPSPVTPRLTPTTPDPHPNPCPSSGHHPDPSPIPNPNQLAKLMGHRAAERITKSRMALSKVCFSARLHVRTYHPARKLVRRHHSLPLLTSYAPYLRWPRACRTWRVAPSSERCSAIASADGCWPGSRRCTVADSADRLLGT